MYTFLGVAQHVAFCSLKYPVDATRQREHEYYVEVVHDTRSQRSKMCEIYEERGKGLGREWPATAREEVRWV